ncbi:hypothetical protein MRX96_034222 [Rhipicephalus microplus]
MRNSTFEPKSSSSLLGAGSLKMSSGSPTSSNTRELTDGSGYDNGGTMYASHGRSHFSHKSASLRIQYSGGQVGGYLYDGSTHGEVGEPTCSQLPSTMLLLRSLLAPSLPSSLYVYQRQS